MLPLRLTNVEKVVEQLKPHLLDYLREQELDPDRLFRCINPKHDDAKASCGIVPQSNGTVFHCLGCNCSGDLLAAYSLIESTPTTGQEWITQTVIPLAQKYEIEIEFKELTEEDVYMLNTYAAYKAAAMLVACKSFGDYTEADKEIEKRGWDKKILEDLEIGTVNFKEFREALKAIGYGAKFLDEIDLGRSDIFDNGNLIYTFHDLSGRPVGFSARNLNYNSESTNRKFVNQQTTGLRCNIFQKGKRLYHLDRSKAFAEDGLYLFEGLPDVVTAYHHGVYNCCAIGGIGLTNDQVSLLREINASHIVLTLDADAKSKVSDLLDKRLGGRAGLKTYVTSLPIGKDPDDYIRENGKEAFLKLRKLSAFEWRLSQFDEGVEPEEICEKMVPFIVSETSFITRDMLSKTLAEYTGITLKVIESEIERIVNLRAEERAQKKVDLAEKLMRDIRRDPDGARLLIEETLRDVETVDDKYGTDAFSEETFIEFIGQEKERQESMTDEFPGFHLYKDGLGEIGERLEGNWKKDKFILISGVPNSGKSSFAMQLGWEIAKHPRNNSIVIYHTIDDSGSEALPKFVIHGYGNPDLTINEVENPAYFAKKTRNGVLKNRSEGYGKLLALAQDARLILKERGDGASINYIYALVKYYRRRFPTRNLVYILDNLHKLPDCGHLGDERIKFKTISHRLKEIAAGEHICFIATVEDVKGTRGMPGNDSIAETRALIFDANLTLHVYNEVHEKGEYKAACVHEHEGITLPRLQIGFGKSKISAFKSSVFLDFYPASGLLRRTDVDIALTELKAREEILKGEGYVSKW